MTSGSISWMIYAGYSHGKGAQDFLLLPELPYVGIQIPHRKICPPNSLASAGCFPGLYTGNQTPVPDPIFLMVFATFIVFLPFFPLCPQVILSAANCCRKNAAPLVPTKPPGFPLMFSFQRNTPTEPSIQTSALGVDELLFHHFLSYKKVQREQWTNKGCSVRNRTLHP